MSGDGVAVHILLTAGVLAQLICCLGVVLGKTAFDRLHYAGAGSTLGPLLITAAVIVLRGVDASSLETIVAALVLLAPSPIIAHALARTARQIYFGQVEARPEELELGGR
jgi:monovalent cation/proton antiporter MnhG/PhaG subunit